VERTSRHYGEQVGREHLGRDPGLHARRMPDFTCDVMTVSRAPRRPCWKSAPQAAFDLLNTVHNNKK
jgi:hypothetical protein